MTAKKTLRAFVHDRSFLARRHASLLVEEELLEDHELRALQLAYRSEVSHAERTLIARRFERLVRTIERHEPTFQQALLACLGPTVVLDGSVSASKCRLLEERWERWDARHGFAWRVRHDLMHNGDTIEAFRRLTGRKRPETNLATIKSRIPHLRERARAELGLPEQPRDPPGWRYVA